LVDLREATTWGLVAAAAFAVMAALALVGVVLLFGQWWRTRPRATVQEQLRPAVAGEPSPGRQPAATSDGPGSSRDAPTSPSRARTGPATAPRDPVTPRPASALDPPAIASAVRTTILEQVVSRCPAGWTALLLSPPPHNRQMTWHLHLQAEVALDLVDGRTVPTTPPTAAQEWRLPAGRQADLASGDPEPAPGQETKAVRVTGVYVSVTHQAGNPGLFLVRRSNASGGQREYRVPATEPSKLAAALAEGLGGALDDPAGQSLAMGYTAASWAMHERAWLRVGTTNGGQ
jgi:hypothetical protein